MQHFDSDGARLAFIDRGAGEPILLMHGFASNMQVNWANTGWIDALVADGRRVLAFDHRGHGQSEAPHEAAAYGLDVMAEDARRLLDAAGIVQADVMGYSMGARIGAVLAIRHEERVRGLLLGGVGANLTRGMEDGADSIARALEADHPDAEADPVAQGFRVFADRTGSDRIALAACIRAVRRPIAAEDLARIRKPVFAAVGTKDSIAGSQAELKTIFQNFELLEIAGRDHMQSVGDKAHKQGVLSFLRRRA